MTATPVQCACGQVVLVPVGSALDGVRCSSCGAKVRAKPSGQNRRGFELDAPDSQGAERPPADDIDAEESGREYGVMPAIESDAGKREPGVGDSRGGTWVPTRGKSPELGGCGRSAPRPFGTGGQPLDLLDRIRKPVELPGPFFKWSALVYPFLHPNWIRWLGLSFMTMLAAGVVSVTLFVASIVIRFWLLLSIFTIGSMGLVCLALVSYVIANFVSVIEETASGEDRLERTTDLTWWDMLPRFMQALGAAVVTAAVTIGVTYPLRRWFPWDTPGLILAQSIIVYQLFPVLLIVNLIDGSWFPYKSLPATLRRLAACVAYVVAFWLITAPVAVVVDAGLRAMFRVHITAGIVAAGALGAAWLMFYGHWLGRLARQLSAAD